MNVPRKIVLNFRMCTTRFSDLHPPTKKPWRNKKPKPFSMWDEGNLYLRVLALNSVTEWNEDKSVILEISICFFFFLSTYIFIGYNPKSQRGSRQQRAPTQAMSKIYFILLLCIPYPSYQRRSRGKCDSLICHNAIPVISNKMPLILRWFNHTLFKHS